MAVPAAASRRQIDAWPDRAWRLGRNHGGLRASRSERSDRMTAGDANRDGARRRRCEASRRSAVPAFIVMDVMQAAAEREATWATRSSTWRWASPARRRPRAALAGRRSAHSEPRRWATRWRSVCRRCGSASPGYYPERYGVAVAPERVVVTTGSSAGFVLAFLALFDAGAKVALPSPGYPCYRHILTALGQAPVLLDDRCRARAGCRPAAQIDDCGRARAAAPAWSSPARPIPTGTMLEPGAARRDRRRLPAQRIWLVSDEIYHGLTYGMREETALAHSATRRSSSTASRSISR